MKRICKVLGIFLAVQIGVFALVQASRDEGGLRDPVAFLPDFDAAKIDRVEIFAPAPENAAGEDGNKDKTQKLELSKSSGGWVLSSHFDYPAKKKKVEDLLGKLAALKIRGPVTTRPARHAQLKVADEEFERRLVLHQGDKETVIFVGDSPGFRKVHVRLEDTDNVYAVSDLSAWDVGKEISNWVNTTYFEIEADDVVSLSVQTEKETFEFAQDEEDGTWNVIAPQLTPPKQKVLDTSKIEGFVNSVATIRLSEPVGKESKPEFGFDEPQARILVVTEKKPTSAAIQRPSAVKPAEAPGSPVPERAEYEIVIGGEKDGKYYVQASGTSHVVLVPNSSVKNLAELSRSDLYEDAPKE